MFSLNLLLTLVTHYLLLVSARGSRSKSNSRDSDCDICDYTVDRTWDDNINSDYINVCANGNQFDRILVFAISTNNIPNPVGIGDDSVLRDVLGWDDTQILQHRAFAESWFNDNFGIDFSTVSLGSGSDVTDGKTLNGIAMNCYALSTDAQYRVLVDTNVNKKPFKQLKDCPIIRDGGWSFAATQDMTTPNGIQLFTGDTVFLGFYIIVDKSGSAEVIHFGTRNGVIRAADVDGWVGLKADIWIPDENFEPIEGTEGSLVGMFQILPANSSDPSNGLFQMRARNVLSWGAYAPDFFG